MVDWPYNEYPEHPARTLAYHSIVDGVVKIVSSYEQEWRLETSDLSEVFDEKETQFVAALGVLLTAIEQYEERKTDYVRALNDLPYKKYLKTWHWRLIKLSARKRAKNRCQVCNAKSGDDVLHTHHRTYVRRGEEQPEDVIILCQACHGDFHKKGKLKPE